MARTRQASAPESNGGKASNKPLATKMAHTKRTARKSTRRKAAQTKHQATKDARKKKSAKKPLQKKSWDSEKLSDQKSTELRIIRDLQFDALVQNIAKISPTFESFFQKFSELFHANGV